MLKAASRRIGHRSPGLVGYVWHVPDRIVGRREPPAVNLPVARRLPPPAREKKAGRGGTAVVSQFPTV